jgi:ABC-type glycerol-3-phosphate transport system substrate-binding protein
MVGASDRRDSRDLRGLARRRVLAQGAVVAGGGVLAACGPVQGPGAGEGASRAKQPVTLKLNYRTEQYIPKRTEQFTQQYPHMKVETLTDTGYEKLVAQIAAGDPGDVIWMSTGIGTFFEMSALGNTMNIESLAAADKYDLKQHLQVGIDTARIVDNKLFGLPSLMHPSHIGLFYNVNHFETAGIKPPTLNTTYDELAEIARKMQSPSVWGIQTESTAAAHFVPWVRSFGGELMDPGFLGKKVAFDRAPARQALQYLYDLRHRHRVHPITGVDRVNFVDGNLAMQTTLMSGGFRFETQIAGKFKMDAVLIPKGPGGKRGSQGHVDMWGMFSRTKLKDEAWLLHKWMVNKDTGLALFGEVGLPGCRVDNWNDPAIQAKPMFKVFKDVIEKEGVGLVALPYNLRMLEFTNTLIPKAFEPMWTGTPQSVDQTIAATVGPINTFLDQPRPSAAR